MNNPNANYLSNPNKLSTRVHYAPGGASSLSLAWNDTPTPPINNRQKSNSQHMPPPYQSPYYKPQLQQQIQPNYASQQRPQDQYAPQRGYMQPIQGNPNSGDSNRMLEDKLQYYQQKNKMLRQNFLGGGGHENQEPSNYNPRTPEYGNPYGNKPQVEPVTYGYQPSYNQEIPKFVKQPQQLELAVYQQNRRKTQERQEPTYGQNLGYYNPTTGQDRTSVKVHNPPGGRSTISFG